MAFLKIKNRAASTLASGVDDAVTEWTVATGEGALFPTTGDFHITCEDEIVKCTSRSTDVLTVVRAQEGTGAAAHASGKAVELRITAEIITRLQKQLLDDDGDTGFEVEQSADEDKIHGKVAGVEAFLLSAVGIQTLAKQSRARAYRASDWYVPTTNWYKVPLDTESYDNQNEFNATSKIGIADATEANKLHDADGGFASGDVGKWVYNTTDKTYTTVSAFVDSGELTLTDDIMVDTEGYEVYASNFTVTEDGYYVVCGMVRCNQPVADKYYFANVFKNGVEQSGGGWHAAVGDGAATNPISGVVANVMYLVANDVVDLRVYHNEGNTGHFDGISNYTYLAVHKLS